MTELTIDQALQQAVEAHKAGQVQEADRLYTAILKAQPRHPDANHNMGVLAVGVGKVEQALPFLKTALDTNPGTAQFWLSYIEALLKLERLADAKSVLDKAKNKGAQGYGFDKLEQRLQGAEGGALNINKSLLQTAVQLRENGEYKQAIDLLKTEMKEVSGNPRLLALLSHCYILDDKLNEANEYLIEAKKLEPDIAVVGCNEVRLLLKGKDIAKALRVAKRTNAKFPNDLEGLGVLGACFRANQDFEASLTHLNKAIDIQPDYAEALINRGLVHLAQDDKVKALTDLEKAYKNKPHIKQIWNLIISLKIDCSQISDAIMLLDEMIKVDPSDAKRYVSKALCYQNLKDLDMAIEAYNKALAIKPDYAEAYNYIGITRQEQGKLEEAIESFNKALAIKPDYADAHNNMGIILKEQGKLEEAIESFNKALAIMPDNADSYNNIGITLKAQGKLEQAIEAYNKALGIKPDYAQAHYNTGNALKEQGKLKGSVAAYNKALAINPNYAQAYYNAGNALKAQGKLKEAIEAYDKAIAIRPNYAEAYSNMGNALKAQGKLKAGIEAYNKAIAINPNNAEAFWNLSGSAESISDSKKWLEKCLSADPKHRNATLTLTALQYYEGDKSNFNNLMLSSLKNHPYMRSFAWAFELPVLPELYFHRWALFDRMIEHSKRDRPFYEYGVWRGEAFQYLIKTFKRGYGFDTFEGIPEDWHDEKAGAYSSEGNIPQIEGGEFIVGKFEDTLPGFFSNPRPKASIINFDADLYSSTICALNFSKAVIDKHTILIFDEFIINKNWEQDEYKALNEFCLNNNWTYEVLAISFFTKQVAVKLLGI